MCAEISTHRSEGLMSPAEHSVWKQHITSPRLLASSAGDRSRNLKLSRPTRYPPSCRGSSPGRREMCATARGYRAPNVASFWGVWKCVPDRCASLECDMNWIVVVRTEGNIELDLKAKCSHWKSRTGVLLCRTSPAIRYCLGFSNKIWKWGAKLIADRKFDEVANTCSIEFSEMNQPLFEN